MPVLLENSYFGKISLKNANFGQFLTFFGKKVTF